MTNENGKEFLRYIRNIVLDVAGQCDNPVRAAQVTAFVICTMLDGAREFDGPEYKIYVRKEDGALEPVNFFHHEL